MEREIFRGIGTALVTPMNESGVDYDALARLLDYQLEGGVDALIVCATTGEAPTLTDEEHIDVIEYCVDRVAGRVPVIAGTGSNYTDHAVEMSVKAQKVGADALLCVTPYYNKCTQKGLVQSFYKIADATDLPMIVYSVPGRTGMKIMPDTCVELAKHPKIAGIKEATGDMATVVEIRAKCGDSFAVWSGNDDITVPMMAMGGSGCISVLSNIMPRQAVEMVRKFDAGDIRGAAELQCKYKALIDALFSEVNPIPVKAALAEMGIIQDYLRLPLTPMEPEHRAKLTALMRAHGLI